MDSFFRSSLFHFYSAPRIWMESIHITNFAVLMFWGYLEMFHFRIRWIITLFCLFVCLYFFMACCIWCRLACNFVPLWYTIYCKKYEYIFPCSIISHNGGGAGSCDIFFSNYKQGMLKYIQFISSAIQHLYTLFHNDVHAMNLAVNLDW